SARIALIVAVGGLLSAACSRSPISSISARPQTPPANVFDQYLQTDFAPADGFDFAVGDRDGKGSYQDQATGPPYSGWYVATHFADTYSYGIHTGEDWTGN